MKKLIIILSALVLVLVGGIIACNSSDEVSKNKEGITEISGPLSHNTLKAARPLNNNVSSDISPNSNRQVE